MPHCLIVWVQTKVLGVDRLLAARYLYKQKAGDDLLSGNQRDNSPVLRRMAPRVHTPGK